MQSITLKYELLSNYYYALIGMASSASGKHRQLTDMEINVLVQLCLLHCQGDSLKKISRVHEKVFSQTLTYETLRKVKRKLIVKNYLLPSTGDFQLKPLLCGCGEQVSFFIETVETLK